MPLPLARIIVAAIAMSVVIMMSDDYYADYCHDAPR